MKKVMFFIAVLLCNYNLLPANWSNLRNSSQTAENEIHLRYESIENGDSVHSVDFFLDGGWHTNSLNNIFGSTYQGIIPFTNTDDLPLSFRIETQDNIFIIPGFTAEQPATAEEMSLLSEYPRNPDLPLFLNIAEERMLFSGDRLYFALKNFGGGFPDSDGLFGPFYSYTINLWLGSYDDPEYVYVLLYTVNLPPFVTSGLFKINAATEEMTQIGSINTQIDNNSNALFLSCLLDDLMNDNDFAGSYSPQEPLFVSSLTQKIEDLGQTITIMDEGNYHSIFLTNYTLVPFVNHLPEIENIHIAQDNGNTIISLDYFDQNEHFPLISEIELDSNSVIPFLQQSFDYSTSVQFLADFPASWSSGVIRFSDNGFDFIEHTIINTSTTETLLPLPGFLKVFPNPFSPGKGENRDLKLQITNTGFADLEIYNLKGQRLLQKRNIIVDGDQITLSGELLEPRLRTSGVYLIKITAREQYLSKKRILMEKFLFLK
jgi:hypothetical protein